MKENIFLQSEIEINEAIQYTSKKKECPPGFYVNGKCEPTVSIDGYLWVLMVVGVILIKLTTKNKTTQWNITETYTEK